MNTPKLRGRLPSPEEIPDEVTLDRASLEQVFELLAEVDEWRAGKRWFDIASGETRRVKRGTPATIEAVPEGRAREILQRELAELPYCIVCRQPKTNRGD